MRRRKQLRVLLAFVLCLALAAAPAAALDDDEFSGYAADTLTIKVGYFGGPYYEKAVFTLEELKAMDCVRPASYTFIDNMPAVGMAHVEGVRLSDLMDAAGIDLNSIQSFKFITLDGVGDVFRTKNSLIDTPRYCYYSLPDNWDDEEQTANEYAALYAEPVETMIAWAEDWKRFIEGANLYSDYEDLDESWRFRLIYGQTDPSEKTASESYYWIYEIDVVLGGAPTLTLDASVLEGEVGSVLRTEASVTADSAVLENEPVTWSSSDESVATVDENGNITVQGAGSAEITATFGGVTASVTVNGVAGENADENSAGGTGEENSGAEEIPDVDENGEAPDEPAEERNAADQAETTPSETEEPGGYQLIEPRVETDTQEGGVQNWRVYEMSETAAALPNLETDNPLLAATGICAVVLFLLAGGIYAAVFYWNVKGTKTDADKRKSQ